MRVKAETKTGTPQEYSFTKNFKFGVLKYG